MASAAGPASLAAQDADQSAADIESPGSPRAMMRAFLQECEAGEFARAGEFLAPSTATSARRPELARRLCLLIDRWVDVNLAAVSPLAEGDPADGEAPLNDRVGISPFTGDRGALHLVRVTRGDEHRWVFAPDVVANIDRAYAALDTSWTRGRLPAPLLEPGPLGIARWKWLGFFLGPPAVWLLAMAIGGLLRLGALALARRTPATWDEVLIDRVRGPARLLLASLLGFPLVYLLELDFRVTLFLTRLLRGLSILAVFWGLLRGIGLAQDRFTRRAWPAGREYAKTVIPLVGHSLRVLLGVLALLIAVAQLGYPVGAILSGLGIGGIALALAAQKTVENVFGSVSLAADRVLRVGDWVKIEDVQGSVEAIGLRSTHVRTLDRTLVKIPNGRLAEMRVESFGARDRMRFGTRLSLVYDTTAEQLRRVMTGVETLLRSHPRVWPDAVIVRLVEFGEHSLQVNVMCWLLTTDAGEFDLLRQELLIGIMEIVEQAGTRFAFPTQTVQLEHVPGATAADGASAGQRPGRPTAS